MTSRSWLAVFLESKAIVWLGAALISAWATGLVWIVYLACFGYGAIVFWNIQDQKRSALTTEQRREREDLMELLSRLEEEARRIAGVGEYVIEKLDRGGIARHATQWLARIDDLERNRRLARTETLRVAMDREIEELSLRGSRLRCELESMLAHLIGLQRRSEDDALQCSVDLVNHFGRLNDLIRS